MFLLDSLCNKTDNCKAMLNKRCIHLLVDILVQVHAEADGFTGRNRIGGAILAIEESKGAKAAGAANNGSPPPSAGRADVHEAFKPEGGGGGAGAGSSPGHEELAEGEDESARIWYVQRTARGVSVCPQLL